MVELTDADRKIIKQVEYYFHDINLCRDHFLKGKILEDDGWVDMDTMLKFKRLASLTEDKDAILSALKKTASDLLEVGEKGIRRKPELKVPENTNEVNAKYEDQCLYVKGFSSDSDLDSIIDYLEKYGGPTLNVHMRRFPQQGAFKGSVFATFKTKDDAQKLLDSTDAATFNESEMVRKWQKAYFADKRSERDAQSQNSKARQQANNAQSDARLVSRMVFGALLELSGLPPAEKKGTIVADSNGDKVNTEEKAEPETEAGEDEEEKKTSLGKRKADDNSGGENEDSSKEANAGGLHVSQLKGWLIEKLGNEFNVAWVDVFPRDARAIVRFKEENNASIAWEKLTKVCENEKVIYSGHTLSGRVLSGDEEKDYWRSVFSAISRKASNKGGKGGRGRGGGHPNKKRRVF